MSPLHDLTIAGITDEQLRDLLMQNLRSLENSNRRTRLQLTTPSTPNTEFEVQTGLDVVATGVFLVGSSAAVRIYDSRRSDWSPGKVFLKADAGNVTIFVDIQGGDLTTP